MEKIYRTDYIGEFFVYQRSYNGGSVKEDREWVPNAIPQFEHTGHALVIGNGLSRLEMNMEIIKNHRGGHLGKKKLTTYGCNSLHRDFIPTFLIVNNSTICQHLVTSEYPTKNIVYADPKQILEYPSHFHLIPYDRYWNAGATATWMACFDGMKKVYLLGFDNQPVPGKNNNVYAGTEGYESNETLINDSTWVNTMYDIFTTYDDVEFVWVNPVSIPEQWKYVLNLRQVTIRDFVIEADLGA